MRHLGPIAGIAAHGSWIATAGYDNRVILWDARTRMPIASAEHEHLVNQCAFSADGRHLVTASSDYTARIWSLPSLREVAVLRDHADDVDMAAFSPDGRRVATCALDRIVRVFDLEGRCLQRMHGHTGNVLSLAWTTEGRELVSSSVDGTIRRWDVQRGAESSRANLDSRTDSVEIAPNGTIYAGDDDGRIAVITPSSTRFVQAHRAGIKKVALDARNGVLVTLSYDRTLAVFDLSKDLPQAVARTELPPSVWARAAAVLPDGRIATGTFGSSYALFDRARAHWDLSGVAAGPGLNAVLACNGRVYSVGDAGRVSVRGEVQAELGSLCNFLVAAGERVLTGGQLGQLFDAHTGRLLYQHHSPLNCALSFVRRGVLHTAVGSYTGEISIFEWGANGELRKCAELPVYHNAVKGLAFCDGLLFSVCASTDIAWHAVDDFSEVRRVHKAHERIANACCALGQGEFASVGRDRTLRIWRRDGAEVHATPHSRSVKCLAIDEARTTLLSGSYGGTVVAFNLSERRFGELRQLTRWGISSITWDRVAGCFVVASYDGKLYEVTP